MSHAQFPRSIPELFRIVYLNRQNSAISGPSNTLGQFIHFAEVVLKGKSAHQIPARSIMIRFNAEDPEPDYSKFLPLFCYKIGHVSVISLSQF